MIKLIEKEREMPVKRYISVLSSLLVLPAFAEVTPVYYDDVIEYTDAVIDGEDIDVEDVQIETSTPKTVSQRPVANRSTSASRAVASGTTVSSRSGAAASRAVASSPRTATATTSRGTVARTARASGTNTRTATKSSRSAVTSRNTSTNKPVTARVGVYSNNVMSGSRLSGGSVVLTDSGEPQYKAGSSRVGVANRRASSRLSTVSVATTNPVVTQEEVTSTTSNMSAIAELTDYCKAQYAACMDNYCNVLDDNQGRCSCSKNIKNYEKTETALAQATEEFQNVVQQIRYIGLTSDQVEALFTETEAELTMKSNTDSSRLKNSLDLIKKKIVDASSPSASSTATTNGLSLDLNGLLTADFTSGFDLNSFLNMNNKTNESVSNQRGEQLYKTAANRCKTAVLNSCNVQGVDANVITNAYDLEIDKQCVLYERSLNDANAEMKQNATNAATILQQARLLLAQNRNSYDLRGCIAAIDSCMQDEYVCGNEYELCLDPTGKYIANGEIIRGSTPGVSGGQNRTDDIFCPTACKAYTTFAKRQDGSEGACVSGSDQQACKDAGCDGCKDIEAWTSGGMRFLYSTWDYNRSNSGSAASSTSTGYNAWSVGAKENLGGYVDYYLNLWKSDYTKSKDTTESDYMARYLLQKIGYIDSDDKVHGMCASVMKQCQDYTYKTTSNRSRSTKKYIPDNEVIRQYLNATLPKIKVQQDAILADYAESCKADVQSCLSTNGYEESSTTSTASKTAVNACASEITTCMSVGGYQIKEGASLTIREMGNWVKSLMITCPENYYVYDDGITTECRSCGSANVLVNAGLNMLKIKINGTTYSMENPNKPYYPVSNSTSGYGASMLDTSAYATGTGTGGARLIAVQLVSAGGHATSCSCPDGYTDVTIESSVFDQDEDNVCYEQTVYGCDDHGYAPNDPQRKTGKKACIDTGVTCQVGSDNKLTCY